METTSPPPPPPPTLVMQQSRKSTRPCPKHAALPFRDPPVQETRPPPETQQDAPAILPPPVQNGSVFPASERPDDSPYDSGEKSGPVQETEPAPQTSPGPQITETRVEAAVQMDLAAED
ncbi:pistil-specific extensin-like protein [Sparus aurata]|uniref:pistil-specific extensin-like protein n=1 Tax=Sparus aurata TaxID=8175 RepID=UPI0011C1BCBB|nr:pistil-specific extensin-like protein [Sparus aurata]